MKNIKEDINKLLEMKQSIINTNRNFVFSVMFAIVLGALTKYTPSVISGFDTLAKVWHGFIILIVIVFILCHL